MSVDKMAIFDLDGTLNDVNLFAVRAFHKAMEELGITDSLSGEEITSMFGAPWNTITSTLLPNISKETMEKLNELIDKYEFEFVELYGKSFPGTIESLEKLRENGYFIAVCSNSRIVYINKVTAAIGIDHLLDHKQELHDGCKKDDMVKLILDTFVPEKAVMVGDRVYDMDAAISNGIPFIGCMYGCAPHEMETVECKIDGAHQIYDAVCEVLEM